MRETSITGYAAIAAVLVLLAACAGPGNLEAPKSLEICLNGKCGPTEGRTSKEEILGGLFRLFQANLGKALKVCDADPKTRQCVQENVSFFWQGGIIPGIGNMHGTLYQDVRFDKATQRIALATEYSISYIGTGVFCANADTFITVASATDVRMESPAFYCNWAAIGNFGVGVKFSAEFIDFDKGVLAGNYSLGGGGFFNGGGGSGYYRMVFAESIPLPTQMAAAPAAPATAAAPQRAHAVTAAAEALAGVDLGRYHALVIGNNRYTSMQRLQTAVNDANVVAKVLKESYGFQTTVLLDATRKQTLDALTHFRRTLRESDNLLVYYAGHGYLDEDAQRGYWLPVDAERDSPANWISTTDVTDVLKAMQAKHVLIVADSCYSGTLSRTVKTDLGSPDYLQRMAQKRARVVMTSGGLEPVMDSGGGGHSVFARAFLDVLNKNEGVIEGTRVFSELRRPVVVNAPQTPEYSDIRFAGHEGGDFLFVRRN